MDNERYYLVRALSKSGKVVLVKQYDMSLERTKLVYVSPNASSIGFHVDNLKKGFKLSEDYILPEDRNKILTTVKENYFAGGEPFSCDYRIIDEKGNIRWIRNQVSYEPQETESILIEYLMQDVSAEYKKIENVDNTTRMEKRIRGIFNKSIPDRQGSDKIKQLVKSVTVLSGLYSTIIDTKGKIVTEPVGPVDNIGEFYDLFERPNYKKLYEDINDVILVQNMPVFMELNDENSHSRVAAAPIFMGTKHVGTWLLCAYTEEEAKKLKSIYEQHWYLASLLSEYLYNYSIIEKEIIKSEDISIKYEMEQQRSDMIIKALNSEEEEKDIINELITRSGKFLNVDDVILFTADSTGNYYATYKWNNRETGNDSNVPDKWYKSEYFRDQIYLMKDEKVIIDSTNITQETIAKAISTNIKALMGFPLSLHDMNKEHKDWLIFISTDAQKVWSENEIDFAESIKSTVDTIDRRTKGDGSIRSVNKQLIDTYNYFKVGIFIRDAYSGEVLFSNDAMDKMLGYEFEGKDSRTIITDLRDRFYGIDAMRKPFITKNKEASWRRYIKALDSIMDITEFQIEWFEGRTASLIILRNAQD